MIRGIVVHAWRSWPAFAIAWSIAWYLFSFQPNVSDLSRLQVTGARFTFDNYSHKTLLGNTLCGKPTLSVIVFEDSAGNVRNVADNARGYGSGDDRSRRWRSTGTVPQDLVPGPVLVRKKIVYPCLAGTVREVVTARHGFVKP